MTETTGSRFPAGANAQRETAIQHGRRTWGNEWTPDLAAMAPGRIELLGNHLDYNGGPVLAAAIDRFTVVALEQTPSVPDFQVLFADTDPESIVSLDPVNLHGWRNVDEQQTSAHYAMGAIASLLAEGKPLRIGKFVVRSSVPAGVGVSSSAALCIALCEAMLPEPVSAQELVLLAQNAEHRAGTPCGTMDQSASVAGGIIHFNGADLSVRTIEPDLGSCSFLVIDSGVRRSLNSSSYGQRVDECATTLELANQTLGTNYDHLAQVSIDQFSTLERRWQQPDQALPLKRAKHVVSETGRVARGERAIRQGNWSQFGMLMTASGKSSALDYAISHPVVERLVRDLLPLPGVLGARMMGGGEGGSVLALIDRSISLDIPRRVSKVVSSGGYGSPGSESVYEVAFAPGATVLDRKGFSEPVVVQ
jgi:galactokinase